MAVDLATLSADELQAETRAWLAANLPAGWMDAVDRGDDDAWTKLRLGVDYAEWCTRFGDAGYATPTWPAEYGAGLSLTPGQAKHVNDVLSHYKVPRPFNLIGIGMGGPTLIQWGTEEQKQQLLHGIATNEEIWCQLFSEPGAGSDVAGLSTRAVRDGDEWVVNGQKVWTTLAHLSRWGMLLARTNPDVPKHRGLTYFLMDMEQDGVDVRPLRQITGESEFNELFIEDAFIPEEHVVGGVDNGWSVAITTLMHERAGLAFALQVDVHIQLRQLGELARERGVIDDPGIRDRLAQLHIEAQVLRLNAYRGLTATMKRGAPGPEGSLGKWHWAEVNQAVAELAMDVAGASALVVDGPWPYRFLRSRANSIEGGTTEILKNIVAERVLGLPRA